MLLELLPAELLCYTVGVMERELDTNIFRSKLEQELAQVREELDRIGQRNPQRKDDWEGNSSDFPDSADSNETADKIEELEENTAIVSELESKLADIKKALDKIEQGTYGICEVGDEPIELDRLEANPSATTCKKHME